MGTSETPQSLQHVGCVAHVYDPAWVEEDVPERLALPHPRRRVSMPIEESVRFGVWQPQSQLEWLYTSTPRDGGYVRLGPNQRMFSVALTHQLHCLRTIRVSLAEEDVPSRPHHLEHCLAMLKDHILCAADITLEEGDSFGRNFTVDRSGGER